jgi:hypothetical protein
MQWVDWKHFENFDKPEVEEVLEVVEKFQMKDLMGFKYDWNTKIIAQFHATFLYDSYADTIHWMIEGVHWMIYCWVLGRQIERGTQSTLTTI